MNNEGRYSIMTTPTLPVTSAIGALVAATVTLAALCGMSPTAAPIAATVTLVAQTTPPAGSIPGDGTFLVGSDVQPGVYRSTGATPGFFELCSVSRLRNLEGSNDLIQWQTANANEPVILTVKASDAAIKAAGCEPFAKIK